MRKVRGFCRVGELNPAQVRSRRIAPPINETELKYVTAPGQDLIDCLLIALRKL